MSLLHLLRKYKELSISGLVLILSSLPPAQANTSPESDAQTIMIVGYDGAHWYPYVAQLITKKTIEQAHWQKIETVSNPVAITRQPESGDFFVKKDNGEITRYLSSRSNEKAVLKESPLPVLQSDTLNYTQLRAHAGGALAVQLQEGKSRQTSIMDITTPNMATLVNQASAQFHPLKTKNNLFYAHVSCRLACDPVIQEVWRRDLVSGDTQQLTLLNSTSYLHSVDHDERFGYISSNQSGYYHLARLNLSTKKVDWLTQGQVTDSYPSYSNSDALYFIRRDTQGTRLLRLPKATTSLAISDHLLDDIPLPEKIKKIRYLEISDQ